MSLRKDDILCTNMIKQESSMLQSIQDTILKTEFTSHRENHSVIEIVDDDSPHDLSRFVRPGLTKQESKNVAESVGNRAVLPLTLCQKFPIDTGN